MAYDIEAIQWLYGANENANSGNSVYQLKEWGEPDAPHGEGAHWESIWDVDGVDRIEYFGERDAVIDLNAATLDGSKTGGGPVSYVENILGGFTIAEGVEIEDAYSGGGDDVLRGNHLDNKLVANGGNDKIFGGLGDDEVYAGHGNDTIYATEGGDTVYGDAGNDTVIIGHNTNGGWLDGGSGIDTIDFSDLSWRAKVFFAAESNSSSFYDRYFEETHSFFVRNFENVIGGQSDDILIGDDGTNVIAGDNGADYIEGGRGNDVLTGNRDTNGVWGDGDRDEYVFSLGDGHDVITHFEDGVDKIVFLRSEVGSLDDIEFVGPGFLGSSSTFITYGGGDDLIEIKVIDGSIDQSDFILA